MKDIVMPCGNEKEFIGMAKKLGFDELVFLYVNKTQFYTEKEDIKITNFLISDEKKVQKGVSAFVKAPKDPRLAFEKAKPLCVFGLELQKKDFMHHRGSGFNHIMAKAAYQNNVCMGFSFSMVLNACEINRAKIIGRIKQNIILVRKNKVKTVIGSFTNNPMQMRAPKDLVAFFTVLGMHAKEARDSLNRTFKKKSKVELT
ncbi:hypothetical protein GF358_00720 [Candidatus Woesearchaeota archaeon]|nr:hypothetical protein [Candidatus Woesearchaeota archaeon]